MIRRGRPNAGPPELLFPPYCTGHPPVSVGKLQHAPLRGGKLALRYSGWNISYRMRAARGGCKKYQKRCKPKRADCGARFRGAARGISAGFRGLPGTGCHGLAAGGRSRKKPRRIAALRAEARATGGQAPGFRRLSRISRSIPRIPRPPPSGCSSWGTSW